MQGPSNGSPLLYGLRIRRFEDLLVLLYFAQVVGGSDDTTAGYYSGELTKVAYEAKLRRAAEEFVDRGTVAGRGGGGAV